jgi:hypothetical protein
VRDDALYIPTSPNVVPALGRFWRVQVDHSSVAPKNEIAALRETVRGLDPTFREVLEVKRDESEAIGERHIHNAIAEYDQIVQRLKDGYVC